MARDFLDHVAATAAQPRPRPRPEPGTTLWCSFPVPGRWPGVAAALRGRLGSGVDVLELHGQAPAADQDSAVSGRRQGGKPRIIVSTDLAESSLTVPGVRLVIDSGLSREPRRDAGRGMTGLVTVSCSRASAEQRAGRAARQGPGTVVRCYSQQAFGAAPAHVTPEIAVADLTGAALTLACWGSPGGAGLALPDQPPQQALADATAVLLELGAVGADGHPTATGRTLAGIPADPRLARALLAGGTAAGPVLAAQVVAAVAGDHRARGADLPGLLSQLRAERGPEGRRWAEESRRLQDLAARAGNSGKAKVPGRPAGSRAASAVGAVVALAFPGRVAQRVAGDGPERYLLPPVPGPGCRPGVPWPATNGWPWRRCPAPRAGTLPARER